MALQLFDHRAIGREIARLLSLEAEKRGISRKSISDKSGIATSVVSDLLNGVRTTRSEKYAQLARAIGLSDHEFERLSAAGKKNVLQKEIGTEEQNSNLEYALSQRFGNNQQAIQEVLRFADYVEKKESGSM